ncbi:carboxypeptidase-like regulatory domain-containing protein [uncultured Paludibaculum sp.]|uniref:carboxypeptidase-like regulatory domain-containing protein n=1 Tax=uncultured Paludibaculum sp. TaxID=1765020 RepID=UPI002AAC1780|nr:carboxypeptidase-like regulatory domain-containing protein [uncultured Paludibaculum sp.]
MKWIVFTLLAASGCLGQERPDVFTIAGTAVDAVTAKPVQRARIVLADSSSLVAELGSSITAEDGRFQFTVARGKFSLRAERSGLAPQFYGAQALYSAFGVSIVAGPGQRTDNLIFRLFPPSAISGTVLDDGGEPVEDAVVQLLRSYVAAGRRTTMTMGWVRTNDLGEYRFGRLPAGSYYLAVTGAPWYASSARLARAGASADTAMSHIAFAPAYYANTGNPRAATSIQVKSGEEAVANFSLYPKSGHSITVNCAECRSTRMRLDLTSEGILGVPSSQRVVTFYGDTRIAAVPPGRYTVRVRNEDERKPISAMAEVEVSSGDVVVSLSLQEAAKVTGTVAVRDGDRSLLTRLFVAVRNESEPNIGFTREVRPDGSFEVPVSLPGRYRMQIVGTRGVFASQVTSDDPAVRNGVIEIGSGAVRVNVVASNGVGRVKGFVRRGSEPTSGVLVVAAPAGLPSDPGAYSSFETDSDGSFDFEQLRPGEYRLFALTDTEFEWANPESIRPYLDAAVAVHVEARSLIQQDLELP